MIDALGYFGIRTTRLDDWAAFGSSWLGMQLVERTRSQLTFRMDDRRQRVFVNADSGDGAAAFGWEVADKAALDRLAARVEAAKVPVTRLTRAVADARFVS